MNLSTSWVSKNMRGNVSIKCHVYGYWLANFRRRQQVDGQLQIFLVHVRQVFFEVDPTEPSWKVVLQNNLRSLQILIYNMNANLGMKAGNVDFDNIPLAYATGNVRGRGVALGEVVNEGASHAPRIPWALWRDTTWRLESD